MAHEVAYFGGSWQLFNSNFSIKLFFPSNSYISLKMNAKALGLFLFKIRLHSILVVKKKETGKMLENTYLFA